jgi:amino-acid N-acetyltransferase
MHRDRTFVVLLDGAALAHPNLTNIVHDLALVHVLGARVVLVHGARPQIDAELADGSFHHNRRITRAADLSQVLSVISSLRVQLEALFSTGLPTSPLRQTDIAVISGNFVTAKPVGILDGVDHEFTGATRKIHKKRISAALDSGALVLLSPLGYSPSGQVFNLAADELATDTALALGAEKLIVFNPTGALTDPAGNRLSILSPAELDALVDGHRDAGHLQSVLRASRGGVKRCHILNFEIDGALLSELFTASGHGTQVTETHHELIRPATPGDIAGIVEIIRPLEDAGVLVRRPRDRLEEEIKHFLVAAIDDNVVGCCAVYPCGDAAELACVAVHPSYRDTRDPGIGACLLEAAEHAAAAMGASMLFALTTRTRDWFVENGFADASLDALPAPRQALYNYQRSSRVMTKRLNRKP